MAQVHHPAHCLHINLNGEKRQYERLKPDGDGAVLVVPMLDDDTVLMIYEYSGGTHRYEFFTHIYIIETFA
jgi:hypothetical protein